MYEVNRLYTLYEVNYPLSSESDIYSQLNQYFRYVHSCAKHAILIKINTNNLVESQRFLNLLTNQALAVNSAAKDWFDIIYNW